VFLLLGGSATAWGGDEGGRSHRGGKGCRGREGYDGLSGWQKERVELVFTASDRGTMGEEQIPGRRKEGERTSGAKKFLAPSGMTWGSWEGGLGMESTAVGLHLTVRREGASLVRSTDKEGRSTGGKGSVGGKG
jgi:hypothetical protein